MTSQISRLDELEMQFKSVVEEMKVLRHDILNSQINEYEYDKQELSEKVSFLQPIINLVEQPSARELYIGQSAVISKVQAIRKILTNDHDLEIARNPLMKAKYSEISEQDYNQKPSKRLEEIFLQCYLSFSRHRYHFIEKDRLMDIFNKDQTERTDWELFVTNIILANGCRISELCKLTTQFSPKYYFDRALKILGNLQSITSMQQIQISMLLALYLNYAYDYLDPYIMNVWELSGLAVRKMIQLGYHKKKLPTLKNCLQVELEKRLFWSVYAFDKLLSLSLGRPSTLNDIELDIPFPLSLEIVGDDANYIFNLQNQQLANELNLNLPVTTITYLVETCRIRQIESKINILVYNKQIQTAEEFDLINQLLENWVNALPSRKEFNEGLNNEVPFDYMILLYHRAKLFLLLPKLTNINSLEPGARQSIILSTLKSAGGICKSFQRIQKDAIFGYSIFSLHTIFLAGVTLVYCVWSLGNPANIKAHNDIIACSNLLYSFAERTNEAETYRFLYENLTETILYNSEPAFENKDTTDTFNAANDIENLLSDSLIPDNKFFNFTFNEDFWKRLDFG